MQSMPHTSTPIPSAEQLAVVATILSGSNAIVNSVAGSGKTTVSLHVARALKSSKTLLLTYNKRLKEETRKKASIEKLIFLEVHSYHAMAYRYYSPQAHKDRELGRIIKEDTESICPIPDYTLIIIDEVQDMTLLLYGFLCKLLRDYKRRHNKLPQLLFIGDENQCIFQFRGSDSRFLSMGDELFSALYTEQAPWTRLQLKTSYRVTRSVATFINEVMLGRTLIISSKDDEGQPVCYLSGPINENVTLLNREIGHLIKDRNVPPRDIFILAPTLKNTSVSMLRSKLESQGIPVRGIDVNGDNETDVDAIIFSNFHQCKGLERKYVFIFGFNKGYFEYFTKLNPFVCPCALYVAVTRATHFVCVLGEESKEDRLPFLNSKLLTCLIDTKRVTYIDDVSSTLMYQPKGYIFMLGDDTSDISANNDNREPTGPVSSSWAISSCKKRLFDESNVVSLMPRVSQLEGNLIAPLDKYRILSVVELTRWLPDETLTQLCRDTIQKEIVRFCSNLSQYTAQPSTPKPSGFRSSGSKGTLKYSSSLIIEDIDCLALCAMLQIYVCDSKFSSIFYQLLETFASRQNKTSKAVQNMFWKITELRKESKPKDFIDISSLYLAIASITPGIRLIKRMPMENDLVALRLDRLREMILLTSSLMEPDKSSIDFKRDLRFEYYIRADIEFDVNCCSNRSLETASLRMIRVHATIDILTPLAGYRVRCHPAAAFTENDFLQLVLFSWLWKRSEALKCGDRDFYLVNVETSEIWRLRSDLDLMDAAVNCIFKHHFRSQDLVSDCDFKRMAVHASKERADISPESNIINTGVEHSSSDALPEGIMNRPISNRLGFISTQEWIQKSDSMSTQQYAYEEEMLDDAEIERRIAELLPTMKNLQTDDKIIDVVADAAPSAEKPSTEILSASTSTASNKPDGASDLHDGEKRKYKSNRYKSTDGFDLSDCEKELRNLFESVTIIHNNE